MREICTFGSVGGLGRPIGPPWVYPTAPGTLPDPDGHRATSGARTFANNPEVPLTQVRMQHQSLRRLLARAHLFLARDRRKVVEEQQRIGHEAEVVLVLMPVHGIPREQHHTPFPDRHIE
jgi:hypothetical protein